MKNRAFVTLIGVLSFALIPSRLPAADQFWDPDGSNPGSSIPGNWDTVTTNWTSGFDLADNGVWVQGNNANFIVMSNYTVTVTQPITVGNITLSGTNGTLTLAGNASNSLTLPSDATLTTGGRNVTFTAPINGSFVLTRAGAGTVTLSNASTYSGGTTWTAGTTALGVNSVFSGGSVTSGPFGTGPVTITTAAVTLTSSGGARTLDNPVTLNNGLTISGSAALTLTNGGVMLTGAARTITVNNTANTVLAGNLSDDGTARTLTKAGTGKLIMNTGGTTTFLGGITASAGTLAAGSSVPFPTNANNTITINGSTLDLNGFDVRVSRLASNATGSVLLGTNTLTAGNDASSAEFLGVISGTGGYVKVGSISQVLSGTNTFSGGITITAGSLYLPTNLVSGSPIALGAGNNTITITGTGRIGANRASPSIAIVTNRVILNTPTAGLDAASGGDFVLAGQVSGPGGFVRTTQGSGFTVLAGSNTFAGGVELDARPFGMGDKNALGSGPFIIGNPTNPPGNTIELGSYNVDLVGPNAIPNPVTINQDFAFGTRTAYAAFGLELSGPVTLAGRISTIFVTGTGLFKLSGLVSGSGGINKAGDNTLTLSANNTYTGSTIVSNSTLALVGSGSVAGSDVTVLSGAILDASGRTDGTLTVGAAQTLRGLGSVTGNVTVAGALAPGASFAGMTINGTLNLNNTARYEIDKSVTPGPALLSVSGTISGKLTVTNAGAALLAAGDTFTLFNKPVSGFSSITLPVGYTWNNQIATSGSITVLATTFPTTPTNITSGLSGTNVTVNWPANYAGGWVLETSPDLVNWTSVPGSRDVSSMSFPIDPAVPTAFYRLRLLSS